MAPSAKSVLHSIPIFLGSLTALSAVRCTNRSEAFRDLIRDRLVTEQSVLDSAVVGTITLIYDHHASCLLEKLTELQQTQNELVVSTSKAYVGLSY